MSRPSIFSLQYEEFTFGGTETSDSFEREINWSLRAISLDGLSKDVIFVWKTVKLNPF
jgi:hypothetical protein